MCAGTVETQPKFEVLQHFLSHCVECARENTFFVLLLYSVSTIHRFGLVLMFRIHSRIQSQSHFSRCLKKYQRNCKNEAASKEHVYFSCCFGVSLLFCTENLGILLLHSFEESQQIQRNRSSLCSLSQLKLHLPGF